MNQTHKKDHPKTKRYAGEIDVHIGQRIKLQRRLSGSSQSEMADALDVTFQQIQKYERGANRVSAANLLKISQFLDMPIDYFYEGFLKEKENDNQNVSSHGFDTATLTKNETVKLLKSYYSIQDESMRRNLLSIMQALSNTEDQD